jgi:hypothetical protein
MSEYQIVAFRAIDRPVSEKNMEFMHQQSSRAEITPWKFDNEYNFGDFHGDEVEMLRRGYDLHFHWANFGIRKLMLRLPNGLPDPAAAAPYLSKEGVEFLKDKKGKGGILSVNPSHEPGDDDYDEDFNELLKDVVPIRREILEGDLRPLYLAHLAMASDDNHDPEETTEAPVPAGLKQLTTAQQALVGLLGLDETLVTAAAEAAPPLPTGLSREPDFVGWLREQAPATKDAWLAEWLANSESDIRNTVLEAYRGGRPNPAWPTANTGRTIADLFTLAEEVAERQKRQKAEKAQRQRKKKLAAMAADPEATLSKAAHLVNQRGVERYAEAASLLAELREVLQGTPRAGLADEEARKLVKANPTLRSLVSKLREQGFLAK